MSRRLGSWLRLTLPPGWVVGLFCLLCGLADLVQWVIVAVWLPHLPFDPGKWPAMRWASESFLLIGVAAYGAFRVLAFHPLFRPAYGQWLAATPWRVGNPLPAGPIHLVWQDLVWLAIVGLLMLRSPQGNAFLPALVFSVGYLTVLGIALAVTRNWAAAYAIGFGLGVLVIRPPPVVIGLTLAGLYGIALIALRKSLGRFPWDTAELERRLQGCYAPKKASERALGWPYQALSGEQDVPSFPWQHAVLLSLLAGWWWLIETATAAATGKDSLWQIEILMVALICQFRLMLYVIGYMPPISLWGRFWTGRWIIPGYDRVFVAPLLGLLTGLLGPVVLGRLGWEPVLAHSVALTAAFLIVLNLGPGLRAWRLTGQHRISAFPYKQMALGERRRYRVAGPGWSVDHAGRQLRD